MAEAAAYAPPEAESFSTRAGAAEARFGYEYIPQPSQLEIVRANAHAREQSLRVQQILDSICDQRSRELTARDTDALGKVRNGLFGWKAIRRSLAHTYSDIVNSGRDLSSAQEAVAEAGIKSKAAETLIDRATEGFEGISSDSARAEMDQLLSVLTDRYGLDRETREKNPTITKIKTVLGSNSRAINMAIGATFRICFKGATHLGGLGGAVAASAIYGGISKGVGEYYKGRECELGQSSWQEVVDQAESPSQKLAIMRQMIADPATLRRYFVGDSGRAFEFFGQYEQLLAQTEQQISEDESAAGENLSVEEIYAERMAGVRREALRAAARGAATAALYSAGGYAITHFVGEMLHPEAAHAAQTDGSQTDPTAQGPSHTTIPTAPPNPDADAPSPEAETDQSISWRWNETPNQPRLEIDHSTHHFVEGDTQFAEVKIEGEDISGDTGSSPEEVAKIIARDISGKQGVGHFDVTPEQQAKIQEHLARWLRANEVDRLGGNNEFAVGETVHVPASELNEALRLAEIREIIPSGLEPALDNTPPPATEADVEPAVPVGPTPNDDGFPPDTATAEPILPDSGAFPPDTEVTPIHSLEPSTETSPDHAQSVFRAVSLSPGLMVAAMIDWKKLRGIGTRAKDALEKIDAAARAKATEAISAARKRIDTPERVGSRRKKDEEKKRKDETAVRKKIFDDRVRAEARELELKHHEYKRSRSSPENAEDTTRAAMDYFAALCETGQYKKCLEEIEEFLLHTKPEDERVYELAGEAAYGSFEYDKARKYYSQGFERCDEGKRTSYLERNLERTIELFTIPGADSTEWATRLRVALDLSELAIEKFPDSSFGYLWKAVCLHSLIDISHYSDEEKAEKENGMLEYARRGVEKWRDESSENKSREITNLQEKISGLEKEIHETGVDDDEAETEENARKIDNIEKEIGELKGDIDRLTEEITRLPKRWPSSFKGRGWEQIQHRLMSPETEKTDRKKKSADHNPDDHDRYEDMYSIEDDSGSGDLQRR